MTNRPSLTWAKELLKCCLEKFCTMKMKPSLEAGHLVTQSAGNSGPDDEQWNKRMVTQLSLQLNVWFSLSIFFPFPNSAPGFISPGKTRTLLTLCRVLCNSFTVNVSRSAYTSFLISRTSYLFRGWCDSSLLYDRMLSKNTQRMSWYDIWRCNTPSSLN